MTCSGIRLKPLFRKIVFTDARGTKVFNITVECLKDTETLKIGSRILDLLLNKSYEPTAEIHKTDGEVFTQTFQKLGDVIKLGYPNENGR